MRVGIIGGSGLYHLEELEGTEEIHLETPFGKPSSSFVTESTGSRWRFFQGMGSDMC